MSSGNPGLVGLLFFNIALYNRDGTTIADGPQGLAAGASRWRRYHRPGLEVATVEESQLGVRLKTVTISFDLSAKTQFGIMMFGISFMWSQETASIDVVCGKDSGDTMGCVQRLVMAILGLMDFAFLAQYVDDSHGFCIMK
nr:hypothetical protein Iba_chr09aCG13470 [Ipomoea batatas]